MRSFFTRLLGSVTRVVLLAPCLLPLLFFCTACATFPLDKLEVGMTMAQATEAFGEPGSTSQDELRQAMELLRSKIRAAVGVSELEESSTQTLGGLEAFVAELEEASGEQGVRSTWIYPYDNFPGKMEVELLFAGNRLVSWKTRHLASPTTYSTNPIVFDDPIIHSNKDTRHHKKGHKHHHDRD